MLIRAGLHPHTAHASMLYRAAPCTTSSDYYVVTIKVLSAARQRFPAGRNSISTCAVFRPVCFLSEYVMPRRIYTDGRTRHEVVEPAFAGYSIGKWIDQDGDGRYDVLEVETTHLKGPRDFDVGGLPLHQDNQSIIKERIFLGKANPDLLHDEITTIDHALTRPWTVMKSYRRERNPIVAVGVARLLVVFPEIERLALVGPLLAAVVARDDGPVTGILGIAGNHQRRPIDGALAAAGRLVGRGVAVERIESHPFGIDQHLSFRGIADLCGFGGLGERECGAKRQRDAGARGYTSGRGIIPVSRVHCAIKRSH